MRSAGDSVDGPREAMARLPWGPWTGRTRPQVSGTSGSADRSWCSGRCGPARSMRNGRLWSPPILWSSLTPPMRPASRPGSSDRVTWNMAGSISPSTWAACPSGVSRHSCPWPSALPGHLRGGDRPAGNARGRGYGREALALLTNWLFERAAAEVIEAPTDPANVAMRTVFQRAGWKLAGSLTKSGRERVMYRITRLEWEAR
jgi:hypothetical protein